jgi:GT2 family glycosyltransferase
VLLQLARRLDRESRLGYAGPRIVKPSGKPDAACLRGDPDPFGALLYFTRVSRLFPGSPRISRYNLTYLDYEKEQPLPCGTGACLMFRTSAFRAVGGFDEAFFMYGEDLDICRRLRAAGHLGIYVPSAEVLHIKGEASRKESQRMLREFHRAMWTYYRKHEARRRPGAVNWLVGIGISSLMGLRLAVNALRSEKRVSAR